MSKASSISFNRLQCQRSQTIQAKEKSLLQRHFLAELIRRIAKTIIPSRPLCASNLHVCKAPLQKATTSGRNYAEFEEHPRKAIDIRGITSHRKLSLMKSPKVCLGGAWNILHLALISSVATKVTKEEIQSLERCISCRLW